MALKLRPYQQECFDHAKGKNTIVNLPTGCGKTLIAAKLIEHFMQLHPTKKVAFLVPTRPLAEQQSAYCLKHCRVAGSPPVVQRLIGVDQAAWNQADWDNSMRTSSIFLGTAALFQQVFVTDNYLSVGSFSLLVFDECHNATGNSPMAAVMRDAVAPHAARGLQSPRILGLTASFINGNLRNPEKKRRDLEALLLSTMVCPSVQPRIAADKFHLVPWKRNQSIDQQNEAIAKHVEEAIRHVGAVKEITKVVKRCSHVFEELGSHALFYYIDKVIVQQVIEKANSLREQNETCVRNASRMMNGLPVLRKELDVLAQKLNADPSLQQAVSKSLKLEKLVALVEGLFATNERGYRGIVFVEQVALVSSLAKQLNDTIGSIQCGAVAGTGNQSESERQKQLERFKRGEVQILVATATLEEGIDVSECAFVVRFSSIPTTKAHIQGAGRARHPDASIFYFENNPETERLKEETMTTTAKNTSLSLNTAELHSAIADMNISVNDRHPYPFTLSRDDGGEVNVFNCKQVLNQYCSIALGTSIQPKAILYQYSHTPGDRKILSKVRFPTPSGWRFLDEASYKAFWSGVNMDRVFSAERVKRKSASEKEEMCFVYLVVIELREKGFLNRHNKPGASFLFDTKRSCPFDSDWSDAIAIKNTVFQSYGQS